MKSTENPSQESTEDRKPTALQSVGLMFTDDTKYKKMIRILSILCILVLVADVMVVLMLRGNDTDFKEIKKEVKEWRNRDDSLKTSYDSIQVALNDLNTRIDEQNARTATHEQKLQNINQYYVQARRDIVALPFDERLRLFSSWISQIDSTSGR